MIKIGDFSKLFDISIKTVRFYEEEGLIEPNFIDIYTGYRYYDEENIKTMSRILFLKNLGLSIKEIKDFDENKIDSKIKTFEEKIQSLYRNIDTLKTLSKNKEGSDMLMNTFINDENAIGKWQLVGAVKEKEDFSKGKFLNLEDPENDERFLIKELYLMERGEEYWVISWTKGTIFICDRPCPYEIEDDLIFVKFIDPINNVDYKIIVYKKIDNKHYTIEEIKQNDDINIDFKYDEIITGFWKAVDYVRNINIFNPNKKSKVELFIDRMSISPEGDVAITFKSGYARNTKYSKGYIFNMAGGTTSAKYITKEINNKTYLIVEWKSGDYIYGKAISGYYVFEKTK